MKISIIGSFQKYYQEICVLIEKLGSLGHNILSPTNSTIINSVNDFVIFESDNKSYLPYEIQTETLNKILQSEIVYVYCPNGYVGRTTCYEIGVLKTTIIPVIFSDMPKDLPIYISPNNIVPKEVFPMWLSNKIVDSKKGLQPVHNLDMCKSRFIKKRLVICGSMTFFDDMERIKSALEEFDIPAITPKEENSYIKKLTNIEFSAFKRKASMQYLSKIRENTCFGVLIVNNEKNGQKNYIGTNTLVEISMAFSWGRPIFLYNDYYEQMRDELEAWNAICLQQDLTKLVDYYNKRKYYIEDSNKNDRENNCQVNGQLRYF